MDMGHFQFISLRNQFFIVKNTQFFEVQVTVHRKQDYINAKILPLASKN